MKFFYLIKKIFLYILYFFPAILIFIFIRSISPIKIIKFGLINSHRIGHFTIEWEIFERLNLKKKMNVFFLSFQKKISNKFLEKLIRKKSLIFPSKLIYIIYILNKSIIGNREHEFNFHNLNYDYSKFKKKIDNSKPTLHLDESEHQKEMRLNREFLNLINSKKIVCIMSRDGKYLTNKSIKKNDYKNYRNSNINDFIPAIKVLEKKGYFIIRMGNLVKNKLNYKSKSVIDYSNSKYVNDFLDIYLINKCEFVISTGFGIDTVAMIYNKPMIFLNYLPIGECSVFSKNVRYTYKKVLDLKNKKYFKLSQLFKNGIAYEIPKASILAKKKMKIISMNGKEIKKVVLELEKNYKTNTKLKKFQILFKKKYNKMKIKFPSGNNYLGKLTPNVSEYFLKQNKYLLK